MKLFITARAGAKQEKIEKIDDTHFRVSVKAIPENGKANAAIEEALAAYFGIARTRVAVVSGTASKRKIVELL